MGSNLARLLRSGLLGVVLSLGMTGSPSVADELVVLPQPREATYVTKALNAKQDWGAFVLYPGNGGRATYSLNQTLFRRRLNYVATFQSRSNPWVAYWVYREAEAAAGQPPIQWAFQIDYPTLNGFVVYIKVDGSDPFVAEGWKIYDFAW